MIPRPLKWPVQSQGQAQHPDFYESGGEPRVHDGYRRSEDPVTTPHGIAQSGYSPIECRSLDGVKRDIIHRAGHFIQRQTGFMTSDGQFLYQASILDLFHDILTVGFFVFGGLQ